MLDSVRSSFFWNQLHHSWSETHNDHLKEEKSNTDKAETKDHTTVKSSDEAFVLAFTAEVGYSNICVGCNLHADKACQHRGEGTNKEGNGCEGGLDFAPGLVYSD